VHMKVPITTARRPPNRSETCAQEKRKKSTIRVKVSERR
jgi:hypothetical protein